MLRANNETKENEYWSLTPKTGNRVHGEESDREEKWSTEEKIKDKKE